jgi:hypothetical protein
MEKSLCGMRQVEEIYMKHLKQCIQCGSEFDTELGSEIHYLFHELQVTNVYLYNLSESLKAILRHGRD